MSRKKKNTRYLLVTNDAAAQIIYDMPTQKNLAEAIGLTIHSINKAIKRNGTVKKKKYRVEVLDLEDE